VAGELVGQIDTHARSVTHEGGTADRALQALNYQHLHGRSMRIMPSNRDPSMRQSGAGNLIVQNLVPSVDSKVLHDTFLPFGKILSCKVRCMARFSAFSFLCEHCCRVHVHVG
jgi:hypothetical protein